MVWVWYIIFWLKNGGDDVGWVVGVAILMFVGFYETLNSGMNSHKYKAVKILHKNGYT